MSVSRSDGGAKSSGSLAHAAGDPDGALGEATAPGEAAGVDGAALGAAVGAVEAADAGADALGLAVDTAAPQAASATAAGGDGEAAATSAGRSGRRRVGVGHGVLRGLGKVRSYAAIEVRPQRVGCRPAPLRRPTPL